MNVHKEKLQVIGRIGMSLALVLILPIGFLLLLQAEPFESVRNHNSSMLIQIGLQNGGEYECIEDLPEYVPRVRRVEDDRDEGIGSIPFSSGGGVDTGGLFDLISWLFIIGIAVLAVILLYFLVNRVLGSRLLRSDTSDSSDGDFGGMGPIKENPIKSAEGLASTGDYRSALRLLYRGILGRLIQLGVLDAQRHRTNWEILGILQSHGHAEIYRTLFPVTKLFDRAWYGETAISADEFHQARDATQLIMQSGDQS